MSVKAIILALGVSLALCVGPVASCGYTDHQDSESAVKIVKTKPGGGRVELLTVPRYNKGSWFAEDYQVSVLILNAETCQPATSTVWYKDNLGANHDFTTSRKGEPGHKHIWKERIGRPMYGVHRVRAWKNKNVPLLFVVSYGPAAPIGTSTTPFAPAPRVSTSSEKTSSSSTITITLRHFSSFEVTYEIIDATCGNSMVLRMQPWEVMPINICSDGGYGKLIFRDIRNPPGTGTEVSLIRSGETVNIT